VLLRPVLASQQEQRRDGSDSNGAEPHAHGLRQCGLRQRSPSSRLHKPVPPTTIGSVARHPGYRRHARFPTRHSRNESVDVRVVNRPLQIRMAAGRRRA
jgi:hypothetical protein